MVGIFFRMLGSPPATVLGEEDTRNMYGHLLKTVLELRKHHSDKIELEGWARGYFYVHKAFGYVLALFLIAGLSGLAK
jgi:hypothetical protein